ncbi:MAG: TadE family type IV pilus minor pilin [Segniliparus sp.]|uniref:TadE family type IV pilus minor pilin n=1 Tax=Segniliparus sp. TaxID=2804064 RepID=UPI003F2D0365
MVTVESAIGVASILFVLFGSAVALLAVGDHVRCVDAAREAARLASRGDLGHASSAAERVGPRGADIRIEEGPGEVVATVTFKAQWLASLDLGAKAVAAMEPVAGP